jgi:hypothetical protein
MIGRQSAYVELGLKPGADRAQIDEAYRRLIKLHHPDRPGGNGERAAQINCAYRELRNQPPDTLPVQVQPRPPVRLQRPRFRLHALAAVCLAAIFFLSRSPRLFHSVKSVSAMPAMAAGQ